MELIIKDWLKQEPNSEDVAPAPEGGLHIPIEKAETLLDTFDSWSTQNFNYFFYRDGYSNNCVGAALEVVVEYMEYGKPMRRTFVGACDFSMKSLFPNKHFLATAKSLCIKNAISDIGKKLGRGLNSEMMPSEEARKEADGGVTLLNSLDEVKPKGYVK